MTRDQKLIKNKIGLLELAKYLKNVSHACRTLGYSRDTFYRVRDAFESGGIEALQEVSRKKPNLKNRVAPEIEEAVIKIAIDNPALGQVRVANELAKSGIKISPGGVRTIWLRHNLETMKKRLKALEAEVAKTGQVLTESQLIALENAYKEKEAVGEIETEHRSYLGSQDTFYVGHLKGVGRVYQQTFVDTYSKHAICKLYPEKTAITAADMINDAVIPFYEQHDTPILRILTDRGTEYCGTTDKHEYQLILALSDIEHTRTKARSPQTNGICERFHKTILTEFYQVAFRKKVYTNIDELQLDLDIWLNYYNYERTHQGKMCLGRTPWDTFMDGHNITKQKMIA
jgi:transposase InsO family protein